MNKIISIIIPAFNAEKHIERCLNSIINQNIESYEIIVIDDGSTDRTGEICKEVAKKNQNVRYLRQENRGVSNARNQGIIVSNSKYIMFVDSDDYLDPGIIREAIETIEKNKCDEYISGLRIEYCINGCIDRVEVKDSKYNGVLTRKGLLDSFEEKYPIMCICGPCAKLYKSEIIKQNNLLFNEKMSFGEDSNFNFEYLQFVKTVFLSSGVFYHYYRDNSESLFSRFHRESYEVHKLVYGKLRNLMYESSCSKGSIDRFETIYCHMIIGGIIEYYSNMDKCSKSDRLTQIRKVADDEYFKKYNTKMLDDIEKRIMFFLIKRKMFAICDVAFSKMYGKR